MLITKFSLTIKSFFVRQIYFILFLLFLSGTTSDAFAQCSLHSMSSNEKSVIAEFIFSGKVVSKECYYDADGNIFTSNKVEVIENHGTRNLQNIVEVITPGGVMADNAQLYFPGLTLHPGEKGKFFCIQKDKKLVPVGLTQGFEPFEAISEKSSSTDIYNISPLNIVAGAQNEIIISGYNFGTQQGNGTVSFRNADNGGASWVSIPPGPHYLSWTNSEIRMKLPTYTANGIAVAGSGKVKVNTPTGESVTSGQEIQVSYALNELVYNNQIGRISLAGVNNGGYLLQMNPLLAQNTGAKNGLLRALNTWRCNTGVNVFADTDNNFTGTPSYNDGINSVSFDEQGLLPSGALALTVVSVSACANEGVVNWQLREVDLVFNSSALWWTELAPPPPAYFDFESVALHELGHFHLMQHNNNSASSMYFRLNAGEMKRNLIPESGIEGGNTIMQFSVDPNYSCVNYEHITPVGPEACSAVGVEESGDITQDELSVFPNPSDGTFNLFLNVFGNKNKELRIYNSLGELVMVKQLSATGNMEVFSVSVSGIYFLEVVSETKKLTRKIVVR